MSQARVGHAPLLIRRTSVAAELMHAREEIVDLRNRLAFLQRELEEARAEDPAGDRDVVADRPAWRALHTPFASDASLSEESPP